MFELNFIIQTTILAVVLVSMAFRMKRNYRVHVITMAAAVVSGLVVFIYASTSLLSDSSYVPTLMNPTMNLATFVSHAFFGLASFASGAVLVAFLLRDKAIPGRSDLTAKIVAILWVLAFVVGALFFVILHVI
jgi:uncharacterized membrane protein YozB (DUF420 family)